MREISENDLRWFAARLLIAIEDTRKFGGMSIHELKQHLRDVPGSEGLTMDYAPGSGNLLVTIAGRTVEVSPTATNDEIALAFREPITPLPLVTYGTTIMTGSFAANLRSMMDDARAGVAKARADGLAKVGEAVSKLEEAKAATIHVVGNIATTIENEAADVMAELGQISNDLGGA